MLAHSVSAHQSALAGGGNITFGEGHVQFSAFNTNDDAARIANSVLGAMGIDTNNQDVTFAGNLAASDTAGLTKLGLGTLTLSGSNSYTGVTTLAAGTINLGGGNALAGRWR